ncbi:hypothetical protein VIGAN_09062800 [Vigna angularis var. angularis]|uniref:Uncharacterized protein n=1 Tax=Vigna angularis var. angularis TaxID=157739 RepID=A0A0S3SWE5_PHAAN|nr:hypothetical protein VIGAN_09062800 [Vigna angularis var. angularis]
MRPNAVLRGCRRLKGVWEVLGSTQPRFYSTPVPAHFAHFHLLTKVAADYGYQTRSAIFVAPCSHNTSLHS